MSSSETGNQKSAPPLQFDLRRVRMAAFKKLVLTLIQNGSWCDSTIPFGIPSFSDINFLAIQEMGRKIGAIGEHLQVCPEIGIQDDAE